MLTTPKRWGPANRIEITVSPATIEQVADRVANWNETHGHTLVLEEVHSLVLGRLETGVRMTLNFIFDGDNDLDKLADYMADSIIVCDDLVSALSGGSWGMAHAVSGSPGMAAWMPIDEPAKA